jgi:hypothetical protein
VLIAQEFVIGIQALTMEELKQLFGTLRSQRQ